MKWIEHKKFIMAALSLLVLAAYLFATAPAALPESGGAKGERLSTQALLRILAAENAAIRTLYTSEIVGPGLKQGLKFEENWSNKAVQAGPLPALFLREMSTLLQRDAPDLGLFLGSDFPIVSANLFKGVQQDEFNKLRASRQPQFFRDAGTGRYTAMFPDFASAQACVTCHNEHTKTPKKDWKRDDIMGATTWMYPRKEVSMSEALRLIDLLREAAYETYGVYLKKTATFDEARRPVIGDKWPKEGLFLPSPEALKQTVEARNSQITLLALLAAQRKEHEKAAKPAGV